MSFFRYYKERQDSDGDPLWWPGGPEGFPFRGQQPPQTTQKEYENLKLAGKARCRLFYLSKEDHLRDYIIVRDKCANGLFIPLDRDRVWDEDTKHYRVYLEWIELGYDSNAPEGTNDAVKNYVTAADQTATLPYDRLAGLRKDYW
jgi:hypothetical protein